MVWAQTTDPIVFVGGVAEGRRFREVGLGCAVRMRSDLPDHFAVAGEMRIGG